MKMVQTVKDKYDLLGMASIIFVLLGLAFTVVSFMLTICNRIASPFTDINQANNVLMILRISNYSTKGLLSTGFVGSVIYQILNLKKRDDLPMWYVLMWFQAFSLFALFVVFYPNIYIILLGLVFAK